MRNWGHCSHQRKPGCCPGHANQACSGRAAVGSCALWGWVLPSEAGCPRREGLLQGPALGVPYLDEAPAEQRGVNAARHLRSERHRAVPAAEPPAPPQAAHLRAARGHRQRHQQHRQQLRGGTHGDSCREQRAGAVLPRKGGKGRTPGLLSAMQSGCARGLRAALPRPWTRNASGNGRAPDPAPGAEPCPKGRRKGGLVFFFPPRDTAEQWYEEL